MKAEVATEARIMETFTNFAHLIKAFYADFAAHHQKTVSVSCPLFLFYFVLSYTFF
jgi:hypothetical protein